MFYFSPYDKLHKIMKLEECVSVHVSYLLCHIIWWVWCGKWHVEREVLQRGKEIWFWKRVTACLQKYPRIVPKFCDVPEEKYFQPLDISIHKLMIGSVIILSSCFFTLIEEEHALWCFLDLKRNMMKDNYFHVLYMMNW